MANVIRLTIAMRVSSHLTVPDDLGPLERADVAEELDDVLLRHRHRRLQIRYHKGSVLHGGSRKTEGASDS